MEKKRLATYTVQVPLQFTFAGDNELDRDELIAVAKKELEKRLVNGYFDVLDKKISITNKITHYTLAEKREQNRQWAETLRGF